MALKAVTANRLGDGVVVWLGTGNGWVERVEDAAVFDAAAAEGALTVARQAAGDNVVVEPYAIDVDTATGAVRPTRYRERLRAQGPSVRLDVGKQAVHGTGAGRAAS